MWYCVYSEVAEAGYGAENLCMAGCFWFIADCSHASRMVDMGCFDYCVGLFADVARIVAAGYG